ncbi:tetratricopeptide repeat protein [Kibdelosporangium phytohabitans]|uniref:tetratricopeptide repeat protein n=1 Tax=Kibdelosporangium phytohabitans TaxID=860235 RepID=UPI00178B98EA
MEVSTPGSLGKLLRQHRVAAGLTQETLAERARLSGQAIGALERGERRHPHRSTIESLADALQLTEEQRTELAAAAARRRVPAARPGEPSADEPVVHASLPYDLPDFTGRTQEIATCLAAVPSGSSQTIRIIAIDGMAGSGKSTLALHLAHQCAELFPDRQLFLDLHGYTPDQEPVSAAAALEILLRRIGVPDGQLPHELEHSAALWRSRLAARRMLILLDNAVDAQQVLPLLPGSSGHLVLITSRHKLADLDGALHLSLEPMSEPDAVELFTRVVQRPIEDQQGLVKLAGLCGYLPLAIRLAATRLRHRSSWTPRDLADRLRDQQHRLVELSAGNRSVAGAFELSYRDLTTRHREVFRRVGLYPGHHFDSYTAAALCGFSVHDTRDALEHLANAHLLREHAPDRYTFHDLLRAQARDTADREEHASERKAALARVLDYFIAAVQHAHSVIDPLPGMGAAEHNLPPITDRDQAMRWWERERNNLLATVRAATQAQLDAQAVELAKALVPFHSHTGHAQDRHDVQCAALRSARRLGDQAAEAHVLVDLASACHYLGRRTEARTHYEEAITLARAAGSVLVEGRAVSRLGALCRSEGAYQQAEQHMRAALVLFRSIGDDRRAAVTLIGLAMVYERGGRYTESLRAFDEALPVIERIGPSVRVGRSYHGRGLLYRRLGRHQEAHEQFQLALRHAQSLHDREGELRALLGLGLVEYNQGKHQAALELLHRVLDMSHTDFEMIEAEALTATAAVHVALGDHDTAAPLHEEALAIVATHSVHDLRATILNNLADTYMAASRPAQAAARYRQALTHCHEIGLTHEETRANTGLAHALERSKGSP